MPSYSVGMTDHVHKPGEGYPPKALKGGLAKEYSRCACGRLIAKFNVNSLWVESGRDDHPYKEVRA